MASVWKVNDAHWRGETAMIGELEIRRKIDDVDVVIKLKPQGPLTSAAQDKIDRFRFEVLKVLEALAA